jgi:DNA invertase Pin-like site-specific DNA recombinase
MKYGYARVSSRSQKIHTQIEKLNDFGVDEIFSEVISGVKEEKQLNLLLSKMKAGDTLVACRMDRLGRSAVQLLEFVNELQEREIQLVFIDHSIDTSSPVGKFFITTLAAVAELERSQTREKILAGIAIARKKGKFKGKPMKYTLTHDKIQEAFSMYDKHKYPVSKICSILGISRATFYRRLKEREEQKNVNL